MLGRGLCATTSVAGLSAVLKNITTTCGCAESDHHWACNEITPSQTLQTPYDDKRPGESENRYVPSTLALRSACSLSGEDSVAVATGDHAAGYLYRHLAFSTGWFKQITSNSFRFQCLRLFWDRPWNFAHMFNVPLPSVLRIFLFSPPEMWVFFFFFFLFGFEGGIPHFRPRKTKKKTFVKGSAGVH